MGIAWCLTALPPTPPLSPPQPLVGLTPTYFHSCFHAPLPRFTEIYHVLPRFTAFYGMLVSLNLGCARSETADTVTFTHPLAPTFTHTHTHTHTHTRTHTQKPTRHQGTMALLVAFVRHNMICCCCSWLVDPFLAGVAGDHFPFALTTIDEDQHPLFCLPTRSRRFSTPCSSRCITCSTRRCRCCHWASSTRTSTTSTV